MENAAQRIVAEARAWIGTPYRHQASCKGIGCDCLGLVRGVWRALNGCEPERAPAYTADWAEVGRDDTLLAAASRHMAPIAPGERRAGDVALFRWRDGCPAKHCAILTAPDRMVHAQEGAPVCEVTLGPWWLRHVAGVFRFPDPYEAR